MSNNTCNTINIVISGVGGQGVLTLAEIMARAALKESYNVRVGEIHGMAQRGGHVICTVRIGDRALGPIIDPGAADILVGFEPVETLREAKLLKPHGKIIMSNHIIYPVAVSMGKAEYPSHEKILSLLSKITDDIFEFDAMKLAIDAGSSKALNMVMFGAILGSGLSPISKETALSTVMNSFPERFKKINAKAVENGYNATS